ncbi:uncharacterized protein LOC111830004 [Capsella rubella]|uniref:uncharacterized protein LOC111830004 n=1 Tax=Capsella rubella TaxID=81985 RepID=UPI000CD4C118|nr:uncharacterized protein LOC111830004 [Capsella rubella]
MIVLKITFCDSLNNVSFWGIKPKACDSWLWRSLLKLRELAEKFIKCNIGNGAAAWFWFDNWTPLGPLIKFMGEGGPRALSIPIEAKISSVYDLQEWKLQPPRSDKALALHVHLSTLTPPNTLDRDDCYAWEIGGKNCGGYNAGRTWEVLRPRSTIKSWASTIWFKGSTPRHAFNMWIVNLDRLPTKCRLASWGMQVSTHCCLCSSSSETRAHLFIDCTYTKVIWSFIFSKLQITNLRLSSWNELMKWAASRSTSCPQTLRLLIVHALVYTVWRQRNNLIHNQITIPPATIYKDIDRQIRNSITARSHMKKFRNLMPLWLR